MLHLNNSLYKQFDRRNWLTSMQLDEYTIIEVTKPALRKGSTDALQIKSDNSSQSENKRITQEAIATFTV
ncbi:hypothetical protein KFK09_005011 [Dendrobium nobile]|uniref:Uncharacterized protein n=1 Tax=Dendrobium nobile TaxID=94219 RepID=A0A8T3C029_DENNO|nr:hypothetical protein KFK09_005011 [Dendrobium nobile]